MKQFLLILYTFLLAAFVCCSGSNGGPSGSPVALENYCREYADMACGAADRCDCLEGVGIELCKAFVLEDCRDEVESGVQAGRQDFDEVEAGICLAALHQIVSDCTLEGAYWPESCDRMLIGTQDRGEACDGSGECLPGLDCYQDLCTLMPGDGQPCLDDYYCADDLYCGNDNLCHPYQGAGGSCPEGSWTCDSDLYCDSRSVTCQPYLTSGQDCAHDSYACDSDLYCSPSTRTCRPYPGQGQSCQDSNGECEDDHYCDPDAVCQSSKPGGQQCSDDEECLSRDCTDGICEAEHGDCDFV